MKAPFVDKSERAFPARTIAQTGTQIIGKAKFAGAITKVSLILAAIITGAATHNRKFELVNKGQSGAGTTVIATLQFANGVNAVAFDEKDMTLSAVEGATTVVKGDVLALVSTAVGDGLAEPGGVCYIENTRTV